MAVRPACRRRDLLSLFLATRLPAMAGHSPLLFTVDGRPYGPKACQALSNPLGIGEIIRKRPVCPRCPLWLPTIPFLDNFRLANDLQLRLLALIAGQRRPHHPARVAGLRVKSPPLTTMPHTRPMAGETKRE